MVMQRTEPDDEIPNFPRLNLDLDNANLPHCRYLDIANVPLHESGNELSLMLCNIRSCRKNFNNFTCHFNDVIHNYSCIIFVETWLTDVYNNLFSVRGYKTFDSYRCQYGGGIRLYVKDTYNTVVLSEFCIVNAVCEMLTVEISSMHNRFVLCCIYHPPTSDHGINYEFIELVCQKFTLLCNMGVLVIVGGDFNLNLFNPLKLNYISHFMNSMLEIGLCPVIDIPTKINYENSITRYALLDQFWVTAPSLLLESYVIPTDITDHFSVGVSLNYEVKEWVQTRTVRIYSHANNIRFSHLLQDIYPCCENQQVDGCFNDYYTQLFNIYDVAFPIVLKTLISKNENDKWLTQPIKECIKKKAKLYRKYIRNQIDKYHYSYYANLLTALLDKVRRLHYYKTFYRAFGNSLNTWRHVNDIIGNSSRTSLGKITVADDVLTDRDMVDYANEYFANIANSLTQGMNSSNQVTFFMERNQHTFVMTPTNVHEVIRMIKGLKNKGSGTYDISITTVKNNAAIFSAHIVLLYNHSVERSFYPSKLKIGRIVPAYKSGPKDLIDNYRPISNLPVMSKAFEKLSHSRIMSFVDKHSLLSNVQFGFRKGKNITHAALRLTTLIVKAYHQKLYSACFFLDLRKAFDIVDHEILIRKLNYMGFRGHSEDYFKSYVTNRKQFTQIGDNKSNEIVITKGVPQGSVLGPILFCLYINDIINAVSADAVLFADDAAFFVYSPTLESLYDQIVRLFSDLNNYLEMNKLVPNLRKSKLMFFSSRPKPNLAQIAFNGQDIEWVDEFKYLGLIINSKMSFAAHINNVINRISRFTGTFHVLRKIVPRFVLKLLYFSFVMPHVLMHIEIWGAAPVVHLNKLCIKLNMLLRAILGVRYSNGRPDMDTDTMYNMLGFLQLEEVFRLKMFTLLLNLLRGTYPDLYEILLEPYLPTHNYATRIDFRYPLITCEVERRAVSSQLILLHNAVPNNFLNEDTSICNLVKKYRRSLLGI